jgi:hypothetical protein
MPKLYLTSVILSTELFPCQLTSLGTSVRSIPKPKVKVKSGREVVVRRCRCRVECQTLHHYSLIIINYSLDPRGRRRKSKVKVKSGREVVVCRRRCRVEVGEEVEGEGEEWNG